MTSHRFRTVIASAMVALLAVWAPHTASASGVVRVVDDDGMADAASCGAATMTFHRIQPAIDASGASDTVLVCPGTYTGVLVIGSGKDDLTLRAATSLRPTIRAPRSFEFGVVSVFSVEGVVLEGLRITPRGGGGQCTGRPDLVSIHRASVTIRDSRLVAAPPFDGDCARYDFAVYIFPSSGPPPFDRVSVYDSVIRDFGVTGILVAEPSVDLIVLRTRFVQRHVGGGSAIRSGDGLLKVRDSVFVTHPMVQPMVGIDVFGSGPVRIRGNDMNRVSRAVGLFVVRNGVVAGNVFEGAVPAGPNASGIWLEVGASSVRVAGNDVSHFRRSGIRIDGGHDNVIVENDFRGNLETDCVDSTSGPGTAGTRNNWVRNLGHESDPSGICHLP